MDKKPGMENFFGELQMRRMFGVPEVVFVEPHTRLTYEDLRAAKDAMDLLKPKKAMTKSDLNLLDMKLANLESRKLALRDALGTDGETVARNALGTAIRCINEWLSGFG